MYLVFIFYSKIQKKIKYGEYEEYIFEVWIMFIDHAKRFAWQPWCIPQFLLILNALVFFLTKTLAIRFSSTGNSRWVLGAG
jgi:hypothetical protein